MNSRTPGNWDTCNDAYRYHANVEKPGEHGSDLAVKHHFTFI